MGSKRKNNNGKKNKKPTKSKPSKIASSGVEVESCDALIDQGNAAIASMQLEVAVECFTNALSLNPMDSNIMDALADALIQIGETEKAKELLVESTRIAPTVNPYKWMYLGQLEVGKDALDCYLKGIDALHSTLSADGGGGGITTENSQDSTSVVIKHIAKAHCSIAEIYMSDLCFEEDAELKCEEHVKEALRLVPDGIDGLQTLASLRVSQNRQQEATVIVIQVYDRIAHIRSVYRSRTIVQEMNGMSESDDVLIDLPEVDFCIATVKLLIECGSYHHHHHHHHHPIADNHSHCSGDNLCEKAIELATELIDEDDENIELWYLVGVASLSMQPSPDYESARYHLEHAKEMIEAMMKIDNNNAEGNGAESIYSKQYELIQDHLQIAHLAATTVVASTTDMVTVAADEEWSDNEEDEA